MSVSFTSNWPISYSELKNFNFKGVWVAEADKSGNVLLTDGSNNLWCYPCFHPGRNFDNSDRSNYCRVDFTTYASNKADKIMEVLKEYFSISFIFKADDRFDEIIGND